MKRLILLVLAVVVAVSATGCGTIYKSARDQRDLGTQASDKKIEAVVFKRLAEDDTVKALDVSSYCFNGAVFLVGEYETTAQKSRAVEIARGVEGVGSVTTWMLPKKELADCGTTDNVSLALTVRKDLIADEDMNSTNVEIKAVQCRIVLLGLVATSADAARAVAIAKQVEGVRGVKSYLKPVQ